MFLLVTGLGWASACALPALDATGSDDSRTANDLNKPARSPVGQPAFAFTDPLPTDTLEVRLNFGPQADLDLFVTAPTQEAVYFGNNPSRSGGRLERDIRCDAGGSRGERVRFQLPHPGRYRVGVSYDRSCRLRREPIPYEIEVEFGDRVEQQTGEVAPGRFEAVAFEFTIPPLGR